MIDHQQLRYLPALAILTIGPIATAQVADKAEPASPADPIHVFTRVGIWPFPGDATIRVSRHLFHGADYLTRATIRWPQSRKRKARHAIVSIAADAFGNRQPWLVAWDRKVPVLWVVQGAPARKLGQLPKRPHATALFRVDLSNPERIETQQVVGGGPEGFLPRTINTAMDTLIHVPPTVPGAKPHRTIWKATIDQEINLLWQFKASGSNLPPPGTITRYSVVIPKDPNLKMDKTRSLGIPMNNGLDPVMTKTRADGTIIGLIRLSELARDRGAIIYATLSKKRTFAPGRVPKLQIPGKQIYQRTRSPRFTGEGRARGRLLDGQGRPIDNAYVVAGPTLDKAKISFPLGCATRADGRFSLQNLPTGSPLQLVVRHANECFSLTEAITLRKGTVAELSLQLATVDGSGTLTRK